MADQLTESTLLRLTHGIPKRELKLIISEAETIEKDLENEIKLLEAALEKEEDVAATNKILDSPFTPVDQSWTAPALMGRLRGELAIPSILSARGTVPPAPAVMSDADNPQALLDMIKNPIYTQEHLTSLELLACWKKIFSSKAAFVFKKAVKPEEAPGYQDRIKFPMDLGLIRKMIVARKVTSYSDLHKHIALISHNCVKYNGRETDYGMVARTFESMADITIMQAVHQKAKTTPRSTPVAATSAAATAPPSKPSSNTGTEAAKSDVATSTVAGSTGKTS